jgi:hypothetical protein
VIILDTDHISPLQYRDSSKTLRFLERLEALTPDEISTTAISIEEQMRGWLRLIRRYRDVHKQDLGGDGGAFKISWCGSVQKSMEEDDERGAAVRAAENAVGRESAPDAALWPR